MKHSLASCWATPCREGCEYDLVHPISYDTARAATLEAIRNLPGGVNFHTDLEWLEADLDITLPEG